MKPFGSDGQYRDLSCIHISQELRGQGIGGRRVDALDYDPAHVESGPCDCQLEYRL